MPELKKQKDFSFDANLNMSSGKLLFEEQENEPIEVGNIFLEEF